MKVAAIAVIIALGLILRLVWLGSYPTGFNADEAAFGYNAYSLLRTGRDEWGVLFYALPVTNLRSFGDFKLPLYAFLAVPSVGIFGLTEAATRLPNALLGALGVASLYLVARLIFTRRIAAFSALLLAISPWAVSLSRGAFEANLIVFFLPLIIYCYLKKSYFLTAVFTLLAMYSYHAPRYYIPVVLIILGIFYPPRIKRVVYPILVLLICGLPILFNPAGRVGDISIFHPTDAWAAVSTQRFMARARGLPDIVAQLFSNKVTYVLSTFSANYLATLSPQALFATGPAEATYGLLPGRPLLYIIQLIGLIGFGIWASSSPTRSKLLLIVLVLLAPIPAALAKSGGLAGNRAADLVPLLTLLSASGLVYFRKFIPSGIVLGVLLIESLVYAQAYVYQGPSVWGPSMNYGWAEVLSRMTNIEQLFRTVRFSRTLSEPHIFVAFYRRIPPHIYQTATASWPRNLPFLDQFDGYTLDNYYFGDLATQTEHPQTLLVGRPVDFPDNFPQYFHIDYPNGQPAIQVSPAKL